MLLVLQTYKKPKLKIRSNYLLIKKERIFDEKDTTRYTFSGKRITRGQYKSATGIGGESVQ